MHSGTVHGTVLDIYIYCFTCIPVLSVEQHYLYIIDVHSGTVHRTALDIYIIDVHSGTVRRTAPDIYWCAFWYCPWNSTTFMYWCAFWYCPWNSTAFIYILMCILVPPGEQRCGVHSGTGRGGRSLCLRQDVCVWRWNRLIIVNKDDCQSDGILPEGQGRS